MLCACGPGSDAPAATFPVRLLAQTRTDSSLLAVAIDAGAGLDAWRVMEYAGEQISLSPARSDPRVRVLDGSLVLDEALAALVRFFEMPANRKFELTARLAAADGVGRGDPCERFFLIRIGPISDGLALTDWLRRGTTRVWVGKDQQIKDLLFKQLRARLMKSSGAEWTSDPDAEGMASARIGSVSFDGREAWALVVPGTKGGARIGSVQVNQLPEMHVAFRANSAPSGDLVTRPTKLLGRTVPAVYVAPGQELVREALIPTGATVLSVSFGTDPAAPTASEARWSVEVGTAGGAWHALGAGSCEGGGQVAAFDDHEFAWPDVAPTNAPVQFRFRVGGDAGLFIGQPMVRGPASHDRPNLLFVSLDTLRADHLGSYGYHRPTSPFLDAWADGSSVFTDVVAVAPYTLPTHVTMLTGLMPLRHGTVKDHQRLDTRQVAYLPEILAADGYATAAFTGGGLVSDEFGFASGFDRYDMIDPIAGTFGFGHEQADDGNTMPVLDGISAWIESRAQERWFVFMHSYVVHEYVAPARDQVLFDTHPELPPDRDTVLYFKRRDWLEQEPTRGEIEHLTNRYDGTIHFADRALASLLGGLERQGLLENTVVVITSDHGEEFWEHGSLGHSITLHREQLQVPLIIRAPGGVGRRIDRPVSQADLTPTLLDLLDLPPLRDADGTSRAAWIRGGPTTGPPTPLYSRIDTRGSRRTALRVESFKIIRGDAAGGLAPSGPAAWRLYDLSNDPAETSDIAGQLVERLAELRARLEAYEESLEARAMTAASAELSPELLQQLEELGY
jgi:arylsulfatase A-like enzyme